MLAIGLMSGTSMDGIDADAWAEARTLAVEALKTESARLRKNPDFAAKVSGPSPVAGIKNKNGLPGVAPVMRGP